MKIPFSQKRNTSAYSTGARDVELISVVRALDAESRLGLQRPPLPAWPAASCARAVAARAFGGGPATSVHSNDLSDSPCRPP
jgi:hypothetical protein